MNFFCKICNFFLFSFIEFASVCSVGNNLVSELSAGKVVQNKTFFSGVYDFAVVKSFEFLSELRFV